MKKFVLGIVGCVWSVPVFAGLYDVPDIAVNVEAENAVQAKEMALNDAVVQAFPKLIKKIGLDDNLVVRVNVPQPPQEQTENGQNNSVEQSENIQMSLSQMPEDGLVVTPDEISALVAGVSVANEKNTPVRYIADVTVRFKPKEIQRYLTERQIPFLDKEPPQMVIVPIFHENQQTMVFDEANPLFVSLREQTPKTDLHSFIIPAGDDFDKALITPAVLNGTDYTILEQLKNKYRAKMVLVVDVAKTNHIYTVKTRGYPADSSAGSDIEFAVSSRATNVVAVMTHIMKKTTDYMVSQFKTYHFYNAMINSRVMARFDVVNLSEWNAVEKRLRAFNFIEKMDVRAVYQKQVIADLTFSENIPMALHKMAQAGIVLQRQGNMYRWEK